MENNFSQIQQGAVSLIEAIEVKVKSLDQEIAKLNTTATKFFSSGANTPNSVNKKLEEQDALLKKLNATIQEQQGQLTKLSTAKQSLNQKTSEEIVNQRALARSSDLEAKSKSRLVGAYQNLVSKQQQAKITLQNLIVAQGKNSSETRKAQKEYDKLTAKVNQANKATSNFSKTGLGNMVNGFRNLLGAFGIVGGITMIAEFSKSTFNLIKTFQSLNFALESVVSSQEELILVNSFLTDITDRYGLEIVTTTERFTKFLAAAKQSNVTLKDTKQIFDSVSKASAVLGLKTHELEGVYLALEQMLSKGKVTTEELRRQLGERLPGAFGIMADAIGVSVSELDKMLKKGEVLSSEALPKFAEALEKAYGIESVNTVDTLVASQNRLTTAWQKFVFSVENSSNFISNFFGTVFNFIAEELKKARVEIEGFAGVMSGKFTEGFDSMNNVMDEYSKKQDLGIKKLTKFLEIQQKEVDLQSKRIANIKTQIKFSKDDTKELEKKLDIEILMLQFEKGQVQAIKERIKTLKDSLLQKQQENEESKKSSDLKKKEIEYIKGTVDWYQKEIAELKKVRDATAYTNDKYNQQTEVIKKLQDELDKLIGKQEKLNNQTIDPSSKEALQNKINALQDELDKTGILDENYKELNRTLNVYKELLESIYGDSKDGNVNDAIDKTKELADALKDFLSQFQDDFFSQAGFDFLGGILTDIDRFKDLLDSSENDWAIWATSIMEVGQEAFAFLQQNQDAYFENQLFNLERERDIAIQFAGDSASAREEIERQYEERRREIQQRQAKAEKEQALFNIAIDTAQGVVSALASTPPNIPLSVAIGAIGAAQLAIVSARQIPEFFRGTQNAPEGWALVDEKRPEIHTDRQGNIKSTGESKANYRYLSAGDKIYTSHEEYFNKELKGLLDINSILPYNEIGNISMPNIVIEQGSNNKDIVREMKSLRQDINNKESLIINLDKNGVTTKMRNGGRTIENQNNILTLKGRIV